MFDLAQYAKDNNLRLERNEAREVICPSKTKKLKGCHLYDGFSEGCGLWIESNSAVRTTLLGRKAIKMGCKPLQGTPLEQTFFVPISAIPTVSLAFKITKSKQGFARQSV